jgi:hypothetical protein
MGLLDDAIREHLELKRRRGADPVEVAREQHEALDPVAVATPEPEAPGAVTEPSVVGDLPTEEHALDVAQDGPDAGHKSQRNADVAEDATVEAAGAREPDETAELDMSTLLGNDPGQPLGEPPGTGEHASGGLPAHEHLQFERESGDTGADLGSA